MEAVRLENFLTTYEALPADNIQTFLMSRKEFRDLGSSVSEAVPPRGQYFKHQQLVVRLLMVFDALILFHRTGTGKTCAFAAFAEYIRSIVLGPPTSFPRRGSNFKRVYILVSGQPLINEFRRQLVCRCSAGQYETDEVKQALTDQSRNSAITRNLKTWYTITTYTKFANLIGGTTSTTTNKETNLQEVTVIPPLTDQQIIDEYSDCIFFVDEIHNLRNISREEIKEGASIEKTYEMLWKVFHLALRTKIVLGSATPMINETRELIPTANLILPANHQMPESLNMDTITLPELASYLKGKVSFVRELDTGAVTEYQGQQFPNDFFFGGTEVHIELTLEYSPMTEFQSRGYAAATSNPGSFRLAERQAANFVFPNGEYGSKGFNTYIRETGSNSYQVSRDLLTALKLPALKTYSSRFARIVEACQTDPGITFCYSDFVTGGGVLVLGLALRVNGFDQYLGTEKVFEVPSQQALAPYCGGATTQRKLNLEPKPRYAIITSKTSESQLANILELVNSYENRHGDYLKIIIGSPSTQEGFNIRNGRNFHMVTPNWSPSEAYQAMSRVLRSDSHVLLIEEERQRLRALGLPEDSATVIVKIYQHASAPIDLDMYRDSQQKDYRIKRVERMLKQIAVDCLIHYQRNVRATDVDKAGSPTCDYTTCNYQCIDPVPAEIIIDTYDIYYSDEIVDRIINQIKEKFRTVNEFKISDLAQEINQPIKYIIRAIQKIQDNKLKILNRYGMISYLYLDDQIVYILQTYPLQSTVSDFWDEYYSDLIIGQQTQELTEIVSRIELQNLDLNTVDLKQLTVENRVKLLETAILNQINGQMTTNDTRVITVYQNNIFEFKEPVQTLEAVNNELAPKPHKTGPKPKNLHRLVNRPLDIEIIPETDTETVYIHTLYNMKFDKTSYGVNAQTMKAGDRPRILKPSDGLGWRDMTPAELIVYSKLIQTKNEEALQPFEEMGIYGIIPQDQKFKIVLPSEPGKTGKYKRSGKVCTSYDLKDLLQIMWDLRIPIVNSDQPDLATVSLIVKSKYGVDISDEAQLRYYYAYREYGKSVLCQKLQNFMETTNRIYRTTDTE